MSNPDDIEGMAVDNAAALFGIEMQSAWRQAAIANFAAIAKVAGLVMEFPLDDEAEYGPVFTP